MLINFFFSGTPIKKLQRRRLKQFIVKLFEQEGATINSLNYVFCSDEYLLAINENFLSHNYYTDVITFCLSKADEPIVGEVYISVDRVEDNATQFDVEFDKELHRVILHGALHLCGYKDNTLSNRRKMTKLEDKYLVSYGK